MGYFSELTAFLNLHKDQLISSGVPEFFWETLHRKLVNQTFDAGKVFQLLKLENEKREDNDPAWALQAIRPLNKTDVENIFLIDHAWTYRIENAKEQLMQHENLRERLCTMLNINNAVSKEELVKQIFNKMWKINNYYSIASAENVEDRLPIWYIMDEIGTAVIHSDIPNCRIVPFVYIKDQITYSILFPIEDILVEDFITRDFAEGESDLSRRSAILLPWVPQSFEDVSSVPPIPDAEYFLKGHIKESLPNLSKLQNKHLEKDTLNVYSQYGLVSTYLTSNKFDIVESESEADILWYTEHFKDFETLSNDTPHKYVNQFPFEYVITVKDLLCVTCRRNSNSAKWLPLSYNLITELCNFISSYQQRQNQKLDNLWIIKPYNLARGLDIHITDNLDYIIKMAITGPKIIQKYISRPVLFYRPEVNGKVKFDIRYVLLLKNVKPLEAYVYKNFFLRFANQPFELDNFENYEKHFTVMNYKDNVTLKHLKCEDFLREFQQQYSDHNWKDVEQSILEMLKDILVSAASTEPPCSIAESPQSRALYAADIMLEWNENKMEPKILEINFTPDCKRACDYYPDFFDNIFELLFFNKKKEHFLQL